MPAPTSSSFEYIQAPTVTQQLKTSVVIRTLRMTLERRTVDVSVASLLDGVRDSLLDLSGGRLLQGVGRQQPTGQDSKSRRSGRTQVPRPIAGIPLVPLRERVETEEDMLVG
jgi:hypothetical protein